MQHHEHSGAATPSTDNLDELGVAAAAAAIRQGEISSESYATALLRRARQNADLNAFITIDDVAVLDAARAADKKRAAGSSDPLLGVPIGIKDSYLTRGMRTTLGLERLKDHVPMQDADVVKAIKDAGGIVFGKNNLVEMSFGLTGDNLHFGQVKNPYDRSRISGGSSSGAGSSVAARIVPAATGGDTDGSIRVPAALCGVVGFKPSIGRWSGKGTAPIAHSLDTTGVLARSVEDAALIDRVVTGKRGLAQALARDLKGVRLAYAPKQYLDLVDPETDARFREVLRQLREHGADVVEVDLGTDFLAVSEKATWSMFFRETMGGVTEFLRQHDVPASFDEIVQALKPALREVWAHAVLPQGAGAVSDEQYEAALSVHQPDLKQRFASAFADSGALGLLFPTTPCAAPRIEEQQKISIAGQEVSYLALARNTVPASGAGLPGISIPMGLTSRGLPLGLEIDAPFGKDEQLLDLAGRLELVMGRLPAPR